MRIDGLENKVNYLLKNFQNLLDKPGEKKAKILTQNDTQRVCTCGCKCGGIVTNSNAFVDKDKLQIQCEGHVPQKPQLMHPSQRNSFINDTIAKTFVSQQATGKEKINKTITNQIIKAKSATNNGNRVMSKINNELVTKNYVLKPFDKENNTRSIAIENMYNIESFASPKPKSHFILNRDSALATNSNTDYLKQICNSNQGPIPCQ